MNPRRASPSPSKEAFAKIQPSVRWADQQTQPEPQRLSPPQPLVTSPSLVANLSSHPRSVLEASSPRTSRLHRARLLFQDFLAPRAVPRQAPTQQPRVVAGGSSPGQNWR